MPKRTDVHKVMVIGSGPIVIGQAAEFDYAGTQACRALREEGLEVVLVNSNPATIMTDENMADRVYLEPLVPEVVARILEKERPDGLLPTLGGQTGLNLAFELASRGVLERLGVRLLGTPLSSIQKAEDRELFKQTMLAIDEPVPPSAVVHSVSQALAFAEASGCPVIVRPAYTLGGTGGGVAWRIDQLEGIVARGLKRSLIGQVLVEKSLVGWKEIEYEVIRDGADNCITVCNMENFDPMGIHTGDSIVVAPSQTLTDREHQALRWASLKIIRALGIEGGCNIQFALAPDGSGQYYVIEVNPRVSRSSALASKATGYPIARVAAKIAVGLRLDEIPNPVTGKTTAAFEPVVDYVVVKIPRWPFDKFPLADRTLGTQMKATGEVMAIDRTFVGALYKAVRSLESGYDGLVGYSWVRELSDAELEQLLRRPDDRRLWVLAEALRRGCSVSRLNELTGIAPFFLAALRRAVKAELELEADPASLARRLPELKRMHFSDRALSRRTGGDELAVRRLREEQGLHPVYKGVDTCSAEFEARTPYFYSTYESEDEVPPGRRPRVVVLGSGPIRIGQGIEFDYCSVHAGWALQQVGYEAVIVNNNPETVSTDFDTSDRLYFEPLIAEDVLEAVRREQPVGVVVQFGGQTAINLARPLADAGVPILGTSADAIDMAEDRRRFAQLLDTLGIPQAEGAAAFSLQEALGIAQKIGFPLMVRPSYVLGGRAMEICHGEDELLAYMKVAARVTPDHPVLLDRYIPGREIEVDAVCDGERVLIPGIMEHIERAGIHSGDSTAVFPPVRLRPDEQAAVVEYTRRIAQALRVRGLLNVQFVAADGHVYVLEANPRASRTVPFLSKVTGVPMVALAVRAALGDGLEEMGWPEGLLFGEGRALPYVAVKAPVFSFDKLGDVDVALGPEMKSTGEVMGLDRSYAWALYKALIASGLQVASRGRALVTLADKDKLAALPVVRGLLELGFRLVATEGTRRFLQTHGLQADFVCKIGEGHPDCEDLVRSGQVDLVINTPTRGRIPERSGFKLRRAAVEFKVPCFTSLDLAAALVDALLGQRAGEELEVRPLQEYLAEARSGWAPPLLKIGTGR